MYVHIYIYIKHQQKDKKNTVIVFTNYSDRMMEMD